MAMRYTIYDLPDCALFDNANAFGNLAIAQALFLECANLSNLLRSQLTMIVAKMYSVWHKHQILQAVIAWIVVEMVDIFIALKQTAKMLLHDKPMLRHIVANGIRVVWHVDQDVALCAYSPSTFPVDRLFTLLPLRVVGGTHFGAGLFGMMPAFHGIVGKPCGSQLGLRFFRVMKPFRTRHLSPLISWLAIGSITHSQSYVKKTGSE